MLFEHLLDGEAVQSPHAGAYELHALLDGEPIHKSPVRTIAVDTRVCVIDRVGVRAMVEVVGVGAVKAMIYM